MDDGFSIGEVLFTVLLLFLAVSVVSLFILNVVAYQDSMSGEVTDIIIRLYKPNSEHKSYLAQIGGGAYFDVGKSAGLNLRVGECYLLRKGAFSDAYNLFEPIDCKEGM